MIKITGIKPFYHQQAVIDELKEAEGTGKIVVVNSSRQKGKSYLVSNILLYFALNHKNAKCFYVTPTLKQARSLFELIIRGIIESGAVKGKNKTELTINFVNGSQILFKSAEQRDALRGYTADFLAIDEAAFISDEIFHLILPWTDARHAPLLITSTPFTKSGFFYKYFNYGLLREHNCVTVDWSDPKYRKSIEKILSAERLEEYRQTLPRNVFLTDYLGQFLDDEGSVFTNVKECLKQAEIGPNDRLYCGLDWSNQYGKEDYTDDTVLSVFNQRGEMVFLKYFSKRSPLTQIDLIYKQLEPWLKQIAVITSETNSIGTPYTDMLKEKSPIIAQKIVGFNTSNTSKNALVTNFQVALERKEVSLLPDEKLIGEFGYFSATFNPKTRNVTYGAPAGLHDDIVLSTLFAYDALKNGMATGKYSLTVRNNKVKHG